MREETTQNLPRPGSFEARVLAELVALRAEFKTFDTRLTSLEGKVDARLHDTRPIWEAVPMRLDKVEGEIKAIRRTLRVFHQDMIRVRDEHEELRDDYDEPHARVEKLESGPTP